MDGTPRKRESFSIMEATLPNTPKTLPAKKKAFRRRSSITDLKGRRSGVFCLPPDRCFAAYQELCQGILPGLSEDERLEQLNHNCFKVFRNKIDEMQSFALQKLEQEFSDVESLTGTFVKASEAFKTVSDNFKTGGQYQKAVEFQCPSAEVDPQSSEIEETIKDYEALTNTLEVENKGWNLLVQKHKAASLNVPSTHIVNDTQYLQLTPEHQAILQDHVDSRRLQNDLQNNREALRIQLSKMKEFLCGVSHTCLKADEVCTSKMKTLCDVALQPHPENISNPKDLIRKMQKEC